MAEIYQAEDRGPDPDPRRDRDPQSPFQEPPVDDPEPLIPDEPVDEPEDLPGHGEPDRRDPQPREPGWRDPGSNDKVYVR